MCGVAGFWDVSLGRAASPSETARAMADAIRHRGPDDGGVWTDDAAGIALAQRRLAVVDLSASGRQPMVSSDGRFVVVYNGEVYNHDEIRPELEARGVAFRGRSDTEVILEACAAFGVEATVERLIGMFAFALWDRRDRRLTLVRDRLGIKPLYWARFGSLFLFGSELKALRAHPGWSPEIDRNAVSAFLRLSCVPAPLSIYQGVHKLEPGRILTLEEGGEIAFHTFWSAREVAARGARDPLDLSDEEAVDQLEALLGDAVGRRMIADVPLGAFLSGGVDSSTVVALMAKRSDRPVRTFSIGFDENGYDESHHAAAVAAHLGTDHTELRATGARALEVVPALPHWYDEPFSDSSQIPTYLVSEMTREHVTVALSGDGGDELFAGYNRHAFAERWGRLERIPPSLRRLAAGAIRALPPRAWDAIARLAPASLRPSQPSDKMRKIAEVLALDDGDAVYRRLVSHWTDPDALALGGREPRDGVLWDESVAGDVPDLVDRMRFLDLVTYLPDDILTKVDRASMAVALEARVPIIDHRVVEFAFRLPRRMTRRDGRGKWILRRVLDRHVPRALIDRPKMGFGAPLGAWLRGPLRDWAEDLLSEASLRDAGLVDPAPIRRLWRDHLTGGRDREHALWDVLTLHAWAREAALPRRS